MRNVLILLTAIALISSSVCAAQNNVVDALVNIDEPPYGSIISGGEVLITVSFAASEEKPVTGVRVFLNEEFITERVFETALPQGSTSFMWDTNRTPNGGHQLDVEVFSFDEYLGTATTQVIVANKLPDLEPPRVAIISPQDGEVVSGVTPIIIEAADNSGEEPFVSIYIEGVIRSVKNKSPYVYDWDTTAHSNAEAVIQAVAVDEASNRAETEPVRVFVRNSIQVSEAPITVTRDVPTVESAATPMASETKTQPEAARAEHSAGQTQTSPTSAPTAPSAQSPNPTPAQAAQNVYVPTAAEPKPEPKVEVSKVNIAQLPRVELPTVPALAESKPAQAAANLVSKAKETVEKIAHTVYVVKSGDTLDRVSKLFGVSIQSIVALNSIKNPNFISIGQKIEIPSTVPDTKLVPFRQPIENAGGVLLWYGGSEKMVRAVAPQLDVYLRIDSKEATVNDQKVTMDKPAVLVSDRTMVSEKFVAETLGLGR